MSRVNQLQELLKADPDDVFLRYALALEWASAGETREALQQLNGVLAQNPDYVPAWFQKGQILARAGQVERAAVALRSGIEAARRTGDTHAEGEMTAFLETIT